METHLSRVVAFFCLFVFMFVFFPQIHLNGYYYKFTEQF